MSGWGFEGVEKVMGGIGAGLRMPLPEDDAGGVVAGAEGGVTGICVWIAAVRTGDAGASWRLLSIVIKATLRAMRPPISNSLSPAFSE